MQTKNVEKDVGFSSVKDWDKNLWWGGGQRRRSLMYSGRWMAIGGGGWDEMRERYKGMRVWTWASNLGRFHLYLFSAKKYQKLKNCFNFYCKGIICSRNKNKSLTRHESFANWIINGKGKLSFICIFPWEDLWI